MRQKFRWTEHQLDKLNKVWDILEELRTYKPLTLRQIYYQLVGKGFIENSVSQYGMLSNLLKWARIDGHVLWDDMEDRVRMYHDLTGWEGSEAFIEASMEGFLRGYVRDFLQTQDKYLEVWIEKDALSGIFTRVTRRYSVPVVVDRGFASVSFLHEFVERIEQHPNQTPIMLYFGDFDPSGGVMLEAMRITLEEEFKVDGIIFKQVALTKEDIFTYGLPHTPEALKLKDTRAKKHIEKHGELAVELDALRPNILEGKIRDAIEAEIDIDLFNIEVEKHNGEIGLLNGLRDKVKSLF